MTDMVIDLGYNEPSSSRGSSIIVCFFSSTREQTGASRLFWSLLGFCKRRGDSSYSSESSSFKEVFEYRF